MEKSGTFQGEAPNNYEREIELTNWVFVWETSYSFHNGHLVRTIIVTFFYCLVFSNIEWKCGSDVLSRNSFCRNT